MPKPSHLFCQLCSNSLLEPAEIYESIDCERCGHRNRMPLPKSLALSWAFSLTALIFYIPANVFPFMTIELYGNRNSSTIWQGIVQLADNGSYFIAIVVLLASIIIPLVKLIALFYLAFTAQNGHHVRIKIRLYKIVESIGRWSMLDIFLLAVLVAIMKLGPWTTVEPGLGSLLFAMVVIFTMLASAYFDPQLLWKDTNEKSD